MMLAVMYGMIPSANTLSRSSAPPENRLTSEYTSRWAEFCACSRQLLIASTETPGPGMEAPRRYTAMIARENSSLRRRSGVRNAAANACSTCPPLVGRSSLTATREHPGTAEGPPAGPRHECASGGGQGGPLSDAGGAAPGSGDLVRGRPGERVGRDVDLHAAQVARAEDLDRLTAADRAGLDQGVGVDRPALREQGCDPVEVDDLEDDLVVVLEARELRQAHVQRRLPALEPGGDVAAR